jgi:two-component system response regulator QseB
MHVLVIEDDELVASGILAGLRLAGMTVDHAATASSAETALRLGTFDTAVLDLGLPDADGLDLLRRLRGADHQLPVLVLTARDTVQDKVMGLRLGADDYLGKPFDLAELVARLYALQRRAAGRSVDLIEHGPLTFDSNCREVKLYGRTVELSRRELSLLHALLDSGRRILSTEQVKNCLYGMSESVESNAVNVHIHHLRRKLGPNIVETVRGLGYRLGKAGE